MNNITLKPAMVPVSSSGWFQPIQRNPIIVAVAAVALAALAYLAYRTVSYLREIHWQVWPFRLWVSPLVPTPEKTVSPSEKISSTPEKTSSPPEKISSTPEKASLTLEETSPTPELVPIPEKTTSPSEQISSTPEKTSSTPELISTTPEQTSLTLTSEQASLSFDDLQKRSKEFNAKVKFPTEDNLMSNVAKTTEMQAEVLEHAKNTRPVLHRRIYDFIPKFLAYKQQYGSSIEKALYEKMTAEQFIDRLIKKRPLMFMTGGDSYLLPDGATRGQGGFEAIGTEMELETSDLRLENFQSYDEMRLAAFLQLFVPTHFINKGGRFNEGIAEKAGSYESKGVYVGMVGARFEKPSQMEYSHLLVTKKQNTVENGYGAAADPNNPKTAQLRLWAELYGSRAGNVYAFPTYEEVEAMTDKDERYIKIYGGFFDKVLYKERLRLIVESFLLEANERAETQQKQGYLHIVGLGLGVWEVSREQTKLMLEVYAETLQKYKFAHISDLNFSWFGLDGLKCGGVEDQGEFDSKGHKIKIHFSKRDPAEKLVDGDTGKLLIAQYAWDSNAYPGNEYWSRLLSASGDPAAACCSMIPELQNPQINPFVSANCAIVLDF